MHLSDGWLPLEPSWERKYALGDHLHDDARAVTKIKRRLYELRHPSDYPGAPSPTSSRALLDRMASAATRAASTSTVAYGEAQARARRAPCAIHLDNLDPVADEPSLRLLTQLAASARSATSRAAARQRPTRSTTSARCPIRLREARELRDPAAARRAGARRLRRGHRDGRPVPRRRALRERRREPRAGRARGAAALLPRADGRRAVRGRADGAQLARAPRDAVGLPRRHGAPELGRGAPRRGPRPADEATELGCALGRLPGRLRLLQVDLRLRPARPARACSTARASRRRCGATRTGARC